MQKDTCTPIFRAALFTIAEIWKQPKCPSKDEWIKKMWCVCMYIYIYTHTHIYTHTRRHTMEYYSAIKKDILPFAATWVDLEGISMGSILVY